jgi:hypothetical protein
MSSTIRLTARVAVIITLVLSGASSSAREGADLRSGPRTHEASTGEGARRWGSAPAWGPPHRRGGGRRPDRVLSGRAICGFRGTATTSYGTSTFPVNIGGGVFAHDGRLKSFGSWLPTPRCTPFQLSSTCSSRGTARETSRPGSSGGWKAGMRRKTWSRPRAGARTPPRSPRPDCRSSTRGDAVWSRSSRTAPGAAVAARLR